MNSVQNTELYKSFASILCLRVSCLADIDSLLTISKGSLYTFKGPSNLHTLYEQANKISGGYQGCRTFFISFCDCNGSVSL